MRKAIIQGQWAWGVDSKGGHRAQDIEFKGCRVAIVRRAVNAEDDGFLDAVCRCDFEAVDLGGYASG